MKFADAVLAQAQKKVHGDKFAVYVTSPNHAGGRAQLFRRASVPGSAAINAARNGLAAREFLSLRKSPFFGNR
jgi:hypothetical protein